MVAFCEMDDHISIRDQLGEQSISPVTLVNIFNVEPADVDQFLSAWESDALFFMAQPGFVSTQLHRGIAGSTTFLNYAVWDSVAQFRAAFGSPEFQAKLGAYPEGAKTSPHLFRKLSVDGIC